jgi:hypothetical protein
MLNAKNAKYRVPLRQIIYPKFGKEKQKEILNNSPLVKNK